MRQMRRYVARYVFPLVIAVTVLSFAACACAAPGASDPAPSRKAVGIDVSDLLTGNLSVGYLQWTLAGRKGPEPATLTPEYLGTLRRAGVTGIEDYITFVALEPDRERPDWHYYRDNCRRVQAAGMRYGVYPWLHFAPKWFVESADYVPFVCLEHGKPTYSTSLWAPSTLALYDRFYAQLRREIDDGVGDIHLGMPADYGEVGFPVGMSSWLVPQEHAHAGFWCGDRFARADFRQRMKARYRDLKSLNRAWGTRFATWEALEYPPLTPPPDDNAGARRRWLDFVGWYAESQTAFAQKAVTVVRRHFPTTPIQLKMGYGGERVEYGVDNSALVRLCAKNGVIVRSTHGSLPAFFYKRFATPARFYGATVFTEPPAQVNRIEEVNRLFNDATNGSVGYFDYTDNILRALDIFRAYRPFIRGERPLTRLALLYPVSDHRLRPGQTSPKTLLDQAALLRDTADYDLVDENMIRDGALRDSRILALFEGEWMEQAALDRIDAWVRGGGTLVLAGSRPIRNIEGDAHTWDALTGGGAATARDRDVLAKARFLPAGPVPARMVLDVGGDAEEAFLGSGWWDREQQASGTWRWTRDRAVLLAPVTPGKAVVVTVYAGQTERLPGAPRLLVNGRDVGELRFTDGAASVRVPETMLALGASAELTIAVETWRPAQSIPGSKDNRELGLWVDRVEIVQTGAETDAATPSPGFRIDLPRLARECSRSVGRGRVVRYPMAGSDPGYRALIGHLLYEDGAPVNPRIDTEADSVHAAVLTDHLLFLNPTDSALRKTVDLHPSEFDALPGAVPPRRTVTLNLAPRSIQAIRRSDGAVLAPDPGRVLPANDLGWWYPNRDLPEFSVRDGVLRVRVAGSDAYMTRGAPFHTDAAEKPILFLQIRTDIKRGRVYWISDRQPKLADGASFGFDLPADGQWHDVRVDLRAASAWAGKIDTLRFDFEAMQGYAEFRQIRLETAGAP